MAAEGRLESSWAKASWAFAYFIVIPTTLVTVIMWRFPELSRAHLMTVLRWVLVVGTLIVGINALRAKHAPGTWARLGLDAAYVACAIGWLLGILGGDTVLEQSWQGHPFSIDIGRLFTIVATLASLNLVHYVLRFAQARGAIARTVQTGRPWRRRRGRVIIEHDDGLAPE